MIDLITLALAKKAGGGGVTPEQMASAIRNAIITALADYTPSEDVGADIAVSMDSSYNLTVSLKNADGDTLGEDEVNLPLESMVVNGSYADGVLTLTLKNAEEIDIPISDIIDGLVSESRTIAGFPLTDDITAQQLKNSLGTQDKSLYININMNLPEQTVEITDAIYTNEYKVFMAVKTAWAEKRNVYFRAEITTDDDIVFCDIPVMLSVEGGDVYLAVCRIVNEFITLAVSGGFIEIADYYVTEKPDWNAADGSDAEILNKPILASVATSGSYNDLSNKPTIPTIPQNIVTGANGGSPLKIVVENGTHTGTASDTLYLVTG